MLEQLFLAAFVKPVLLFGVLFGSRISRCLFKMIDKPIYPSLDVAIAEISFLVQVGDIPVDYVECYLSQFSWEDKVKSLNVLRRTDFLRNFDVQFEDLDEDMLFSQVLATSSSFMYFRLLASTRNF
ncbi:hypothetical protein MC7420_4488 [Coleofasciculus chthonoplastes PCC 7420]|uniref:Uncharacterized protein n=1 Tax=Coleofasciculus chthonoplastes PCC 7420 TaxID=118168 RepID=B4VY56_9CYAN|nr:hypothetical protein [Coleofasciculus chthonoplastes]EDX73241.1 hypothetical protein MC7420_4488 [Coleofasciculus chthonoplastes PCC 7420]